MSLLLLTRSGTPYCINYSYQLVFSVAFIMYSYKVKLSHTRINHSHQLLRSGSSIGYSYLLFSHTPVKCSYQNSLVTTQYQLLVSHTPSHSTPMPLRNRETMKFTFRWIRLRSHLFLNLRLAAYIHGNTMLSEYCICDR